MAIKKDLPIQKLVTGTSKITKKMVGVKYGRLLVLEYLGDKIVNGSKYPTVVAVCDCGSIHNYTSRALRDGKTKSCGCFQSENTSRIHIKHGQKSPKLGNRGTIMYARWRSMFDRVRSDDMYKNVIICERWKGDNGFVNFCEDMGEMPTPKHTVDRYPISNGNYEPSNTRWATMKEQSQNTVRNRNYEYNGEVLCVSEIARRNGILPRELSRRLNNLKLGLLEALEYVPNKNRSKRRKK